MCAVILGIETSCDETSAAVVVDGQNVLSNVVASQVDLHAKYGGVVPEIASRAHIEWLDGVVDQSLVDADVSPDDLDAVAVCNTPGLISCLLIGVTAAKTLAWAWGRPLVDVHHLHAHIAAAGIEREDIRFPAVALVVSGGHTSLYLVKDFLHAEDLGHTTDDAAGEAFDKVANILKLGYPGGPAVDRAARKGDPRAVEFPRAMLSRESLDFSFSGIKTAVMYHVFGQGRSSGSLEHLGDQGIADIAASFQAAVVDVLVSKTIRAAENCSVNTVIVGGGVAANSQLRSRIVDEGGRKGFDIVIPEMKYCTDNAAMIAALGYHRFAAGERAGLDLSAISRPQRSS
jgi:N6-L-threonylcarbamoyladenine synthase